MSPAKQSRASREDVVKRADNKHGTVVVRLPVPLRASQRQGPPPRQRNLDRRPREYLTPDEVEILMAAARDRGRLGQRDATMILVAYQHGLRAAELVALTWQQVDFKDKVMHVTRRKNGVASVHPMTGEEMRALRRLHREQAERGRVRPGDRVFQTEQGAPTTETGFRKMLARAGAASPLRDLHVHPHMLRHAAG
jgi:type 1 fimbriae regulatory protein FimB/type 1 fimbriae regulatory protein FimE